MLETLGLLGGAVVRFLPVLVDFFKSRDDKKHELALLDRQVQLEKTRGENARAEIAATAAGQVDVAWAEGLASAMRNATPPALSDTGSRWLNFFNVLNSSVRPILTYWWCVIAYSVSKTMVIIVAFQSGATLQAMSEIVLNDFDKAVVASIIGFWFVDRALRVHGQQNGR